MKKINNSLTRKDGNKLGKRKQKLYNKNSCMEKYMFERVNVNDLDNEYPSTIADYIYNEVSIDKRLKLPSFIESLTPVLSVDRGIPAGDFASIGVVVVGDEEHNHWKNGRHMQMLVSAMKHEHNTIDMCLEEDPKEVINRVLDTIKKYERPTLPTVHIHNDDTTLFGLKREMQVQDTNLNNDDHHAVWCGSIIDQDMLNIGSSRNNDEVQYQIFLRARNFGKGINLTTPIIKVDAIK